MKSIPAHEYLEEAVFALLESKTLRENFEFLLEQKEPLSSPATAVNLNEFRNQRQQR